MCFVEFNKYKDSALGGPWSSRLETKASLSHCCLVFSCTAYLLLLLISPIKSIILHCKRIIIQVEELEYQQSLFRGCQFSKNCPKTDQNKYLYWITHYVQMDPQEPCLAMINHPCRLGSKLAGWPAAPTCVAICHVKFKTMAQEVLTRAL